MPLYEYLCEDCGPFTAIRPMAEYADPQPCPGCDAQAPRVLLTAPHLATMASSTRLAHAANERSSHVPQVLSQSAAAHRAGCACCTGASSRRMTRSRNGAKSFPASRPWMISH
jgi:putative FmdB family regulatory protein